MLKNCIDDWAKAAQDCAERMQDEKYTADDLVKDLADVWVRSLREGATAVELGLRNARATADPVPTTHSELAHGIPSNRRRRGLRGTGLVAGRAMERARPRGGEGSTPEAIRLTPRCATRRPPARLRPRARFCSPPRRSTRWHPRRPSRRAAHRRLGRLHHDACKCHAQAFGAAEERQQVGRASPKRRQRQAARARPGAEGVQAARRCDRASRGLHGIGGGRDARRPARAGDRLDRRSMTDELSVEGDDLSARVGELRRLTIMFCDVVGSTELSGRQDPELPRADEGLPRGLSRGNRGPVRGPHRPAEGRRRALHVRLPGGARERRRAGRPGRAGARARGARAVPGYQLDPASRSKFASGSIMAPSTWTSMRRTSMG